MKPRLKSPNWSGVVGGRDRRGSAGATSSPPSPVNDRGSERAVAEGQGGEDLAPPRFQFLIKAAVMGWPRCHCGNGGG